MTPDLRKTIRSLIEEIHANAASGLLSRRAIVLATQVEQELSREAPPAPAGARIEKEAR